MSRLGELWGSARLAWGFGFFAGVGFFAGADDEVVDGGGEFLAVAEAAEFDFGAAALAADLDVVEAEDLVDEGASGFGVGDIFVGDEGVVAGEEALLVDDSVIVDAVGAAAEVEKVDDDEGEAGDGEEEESESGQRADGGVEFGELGLVGDRSDDGGEGGRGAEEDERESDDDADGIGDGTDEGGAFLVEKLALLEGVAVVLHEVADVVVDGFGSVDEAQDGGM